MKERRFVRKTEQQIKIADNDKVAAAAAAAAAVFSSFPKSHNISSWLMVKHNAFQYS